MDINKLLILRFPDECDAGKIHTEEDLDGKLFISEWSVEGRPKPTQEELEHWYSQVKDIDSALQINEEIRKKLFQLDLKSIRALRSSDTARLNQLESEAYLLRADYIKLRDL